MPGSCSEESGILTSGQIFNYRKIAREGLIEDEKQLLIMDWRESPVVLGNYEKNGDTHILVIDLETKYYLFLRQPKINLALNQSLAAVAFHTNVDALLGPIITIIDPISGTAIGSFLRL